MPLALPSTAPAEPRIRAAIAQAAQKTGIDFDYLYNQARIESSLDPDAKARTSSAAGLFQFTRQTWLGVIEKHGGNHNLGWASEAIERSGRGLSVADPQMRAAIDALRYDPAVASAMAAEFASDNREALETKLGRSAAPVDLYLAHFLGSAGAANFLEAHDADPSMSAAPLFPAAAAANRTIFYEPGGAPRSLGDIRTRFAAKLGGAAPPPLSSPPAAWLQVRQSVSQSSGRAPMQMAAIEPIPQRLSLAFAARAYERLSGLGA
jgi:hypothetical protein